MLSDPIAALGTPPGRSAVAVVRVSGVGAFEVAARVIRGFSAEPYRVARLATFLGRAGAPAVQGPAAGLSRPDALVLTGSPG